MEWPKLEYSKSRVNRAGDTLLKHLPSTDSKHVEAVGILDNWRSCHGYPLEDFTTTLRSKLDQMGSEYLIAQRLKRTPSVLDKLKRMPSTKLARMQDIAGVRVVVDNFLEIDRLRDAFLETPLSHSLLRTSNYIDRPCVSGYRGLHLIYGYQNDAAADYNGLSIELQLRTGMQHAWATAVEISSTFLGQNLKASEGPDDWLTFFRLASAHFAELEGCPVGEQWKGRSTDSISSEMDEFERKLQVMQTLSVFRNVMKTISDTDSSHGSYQLIVLDFEEQTVEITTFDKSQISEATALYAKYEKEHSSTSPRLQVVLVSTDSIKQLRRAYPNYYMDSSSFFSFLGGIHFWTAPPLRPDGQ